MKFDFFGLSIYLYVGATAPETALHVKVTLEPFSVAPDTGLVITAMLPPTVPPPGAVNTYAAPESAAPSLGVLLTPNVELSSRYAPTTIKSALTPTDQPKLSPACVVPTTAGFKYACWLHTPALRVNTYAAPAMAADSFGVLLIPVVELSSPSAPTTIVSPLMATEMPKLSPTCVVPTADGFTYAC